MIRSAKAFALVGALVTVSFAQTAPTPEQSPATTADTNRAAAYYNFAMGRLYALMAQAEGNQDQALKAIQYFKDALKADPKASAIYEGGPKSSSCPMPASTKTWRWPPAANRGSTTSPPRPTIARPT